VLYPSGFFIYIYGKLVDMNRFLLFLLLILQYPAVMGQHRLVGTVIQSDTKEPIAGASVYINNSSIGTSTDKSGNFSLQLAQASVYELAVSAMGYHATTVQVQVPQEGKLEIAMKERATQIEEVVVTNYVKDGWAKWGRYFTETLIGLGYYADQTKILNPEVVRFRYNQKEKILTASCTAPLIIRNDGLGYEIVYELVRYNSNFATKFFSYAGNSFFRDIGKGKKKYIQARRDVYDLSFKKFLRETLKGDWEKEGYVVRKSVHKENEVKKEADVKLKAINKEVFEKYNFSFNLYYASQKEVLPSHVEALRAQSRQHESITYLMGIMKPHQIISGRDTSLGLVQIDFPDYLYIIYPERFAKSKNPMLKKAASQVTEVFLPNNEGILIDVYGGYFPTNNLVMIGYGVAYAKLGFLLPYDYEDPEKSRKK